MRALERIACTNFVETDGYAYFSGRYYNGLYKVELETGKTAFLGYFEDEKLAQIKFTCVRGKADMCIFGICRIRPLLLSKSGWKKKSPFL